MSKFIVEYLSGDGFTESDIRKAICEGDDSVVHDSELFVKEVESDDELFHDIEEWLEANGCIVDSKEKRNEK